MQPEITYEPADLKGEVTILNVWGVWCVTCAVEMPYLTHLKQEENVHIVGLYFDQDLDPDFGTKTLTRVQQEVTDMLSRYGNPYAFNIFDVYRDTSLDLGSQAHLSILLSMPMVLFVCIILVILMNASGRQKLAPCIAHWWLRLNKIRKVVNEVYALFFVSFHVCCFVCRRR